MFRKGESPNPGGVMGRAKRERLTAMVEAAVAKVKKCEPERALEVLLEEWAKIAFRSEDSRERIAALEQLTDRGLGRPPQYQVNLNVDAEAKGLSDEELQRRIADILREDPALLDQARGVIDAAFRVAETPRDPAARGEPDGVHPRGLADHRTGDDVPEELAP